MSILDISLLLIFLSAEAMFFIALAFVKALQKEKNFEKFERNLAFIDSLDKINLALIFHIIAGTALVTWIASRVVISYI